MSSTPASAPDPVPPPSQPQPDPSSWFDPFAADEEFLAPLLNVGRWQPMPADPDEAEQLRLKYRAKPQAIIEGWASNAPVLRIEPGDRFRLRFLRFGLDQRFISTICHHRVHRNRPEVCPRRTDTALGGDPSAECPLCDAMGLFHGNHRPGLVTSYWAYAVVLAGTFPERSRPNNPAGDASIRGRRPYLTRDTEQIWRPRRLRLSAGAVVQLKFIARNEPTLFNWDCGTDFELAETLTRYQTLRRLGRGPLQLTQDASGQERQRLSIESYLGEPHLYVPPERTMHPDERRLLLLQADARLEAFGRLKGRSFGYGHPDEPGNRARRRRRLDTMSLKYDQEYRDLYQPGSGDGSSTNPLPARGRTHHLQHRLQTLLQYRNAMLRSSRAFWEQFKSH